MQLLYEAVPGFFAQDGPLADPRAIGPVPPRFGLLDSSHERWSTFSSKLQKLNADADANVLYKLFFFGRHGQGYHNVAEEKYGVTAWDDYWAMLNGDGELTWGPDPELTELGKEQAASVNELWKAELAFNIPLPQKLYCSPMTRAMQTNEITFNGILTHESQRVVVVENCREEYGEHTCDKRTTLTHIKAAFPRFEIESGFAEEDGLWEADWRETKEQAAARAKQVLDNIFQNNKSISYVSITAHGGIINGFLRSLGRPIYPLPTGGVIPVVVKATTTA
ncbi:histidine phosphatase superfamily [Mycena sp. CBHHK59/15]|nr:histidine phosphatase superfamily [Mycena sp. CBHHK59/15]